jgi:hypothetical protein
VLNAIKIVGDAFDGSNRSASLQYFCQLYHATGTRSEELYQTYKSADTGSISDKIFMVKNNSRSSFRPSKKHSIFDILYVGYVAKVYFSDDPNDD